MTDRQTEGEGAAGDGKNMRKKEVRDNHTLFTHKTSPWVIYLLIVRKERLENNTCPYGEKHKDDIAKVMEFFDVIVFRQVNVNKFIVFTAMTTMFWALRTIALPWLAYLAVHLGLLDSTVCRASLDPKKKINKNTVTNTEAQKWCHIHARPWEVSISEHSVDDILTWITGLPHSTVTSLWHFLCTRSLQLMHL